MDSTNEAKLINETKPMKEAKPAHLFSLHTIALVLTVAGAYFWLQISSLEALSLQAFALSILIFLAIKRLKKAKLWHILPRKSSLELIPLTFAFLLVIGATDNLASSLFFLTYLHLFFLVFTTRQSTAIATSMAIMVFHFALAPISSGGEISILLSIPLLLVIFLFAKKQYDEVIVKTKIIAREEKEIASLEVMEQKLENFLNQYLNPKLATLKDLAEKDGEVEVESNKQTLTNQLSLLHTEVQKTLDQVHKIRTNLPSIRNNSQGNNGKKILMILGIASSLLLSPYFTQVSYAERLESDSYIIQFGNFNISAGTRTSESFGLTDTVGQTGAGPYGEFGSTAHFIGSGFQYIYQINRFSFRVSKLLIDFSLLTPLVHTTDDHTLTITTRGGGGYTVYSYALHPLRLSTGPDEIPNTGCDLDDCTITTAGVWTDQNVPGFGYNLAGDDVPTDFIDGSYFRPFADDSQGEPMQVAMSSANIANARTATVTYKAGISGDQAAGNYETGVVYIAVPGY